jgi:hypothetical protein
MSSQASLGLDALRFRLTDAHPLAVGPWAFVRVTQHPHAFLRGSCGLFRRPVLLFVRVAGFSAPVDLGESGFNHRQVDILPLDEDCREQPFITVHPKNLHPDALAVD